MTSVAVEQALGGDVREVGEQLIGLPEDQWFERKSSRISARALADTLVGFGNADGGHVVVGLNDGQIEGTDSLPIRRNDLMQAAIDFTQPPVRARAALVPCIRSDSAEDHLLVFGVEPGDTVHANQKDEVFLRVGDENRRLNFAQRQELVFDKGDASYESRVAPGVTIQDLRASLVHSYAQALEASEPNRVLEARGLIRDSVVTFAGCLLFGRDPQQVLPEAFVRVLRYRGKARGSGARQQLVEDVKIDGPIPHQLMEAQKAIQALQPARNALGRAGRFEPVPLVPEDAWLEGLVNAAVHRSYSMAGDHIRVEIFDDRIEISSPGRFPGLVDLSDPLHTTRFARNPRIARVCADLQFGQELGEGIRRIFEEMRIAGLEDPVYRQSSGGVRLTLSAEPVDRALDEQLPEETRAIRSALRDAERLSTGEIADILGISRPAAIQRLRMLQEARLVKWVGKAPKDPRAYWTLPPT
jgi:ATP-dependent DNA helicase RecG